LTPLSILQIATPTGTAPSTIRARLRKLGMTPVIVRALPTVALAPQPVFAEFTCTCGAVVLVGDVEAHRGIVRCSTCRGEKARCR